MKYKFGYIPSFAKELKALCKKHKSLKKDFEALKEEIETNPNIYYVGIDMIEAMLGLAKREIENTFLAPSKSCFANFSAVIIEMAIGIPALDSCNANKYAGNAIW